MAHPINFTQKLQHDFTRLLLQKASLLGQSVKGYQWTISRETLGYSLVDLGCKFAEVNQLRHLANESRCPNGGQLRFNGNLEQFTQQLTKTQFKLVRAWEIMQFLESSTEAQEAPNLDQGAAPQKALQRPPAERTVPQPLDPRAMALHDNVNSKLTGRPTHEKIAIYSDRINMLKADRPSEATNALLDDSAESLRQLRTALLQQGTPEQHCCEIDTQEVFECYPNRLPGMNMNNLMRKAEEYTTIFYLQDMLKWEWKNEEPYFKYPGEICPQWIDDLIFSGHNLIGSKLQEEKPNLPDSPLANIKIQHNYIECLGDTVEVPLSRFVDGCLHRLEELAQWRKTNHIGTIGIAIQCGGRSFPMSIHSNGEVTLFNQYGSDGQWGVGPKYHPYCSTFAHLKQAVCCLDGILKERVPAEAWRGEAAPGQVAFQFQPAMAEFIEDPVVSIMSFCNKKIRREIEKRPVVMIAPTPMPQQLQNSVISLGGSQMSCHVAPIRIHCDTGGVGLYVRGEAKLGLSWEQGQLLDFDESTGEWIFYPSQESGEFKLLLDDQTWEEGAGNRKVEHRSAHSPHFKQ